MEDKLVNDFLEIITEFQREKREQDRKIEYLEKELKADKSMHNKMGEENVKDTDTMVNKEELKKHSTTTHDAKAIIEEKIAKARRNKDIFKRRVK